MSLQAFASHNDYIKSRISRHLSLTSSLVEWHERIIPGDVCVLMQDIFGELTPTFFVIAPTNPGNEDERPTPRDYLECRAHTKFCPEGEPTCQHRALMQGKLDLPADFDAAKADGFRGSIAIGDEDAHGTPLVFYCPTQTA